MQRIVIIGSGVIGTTHAIKAAERGMKVCVLEKQSKPSGASVRNFGTIWPIGCKPGSEQEQAMFGAAQWKHYAGLTGFWHRPAGSLSLAYREEAWQVLQEYAAGEAAAGKECLSADEIAARYPAANPQGLLGGLFSGAEVQIRSANALEHLRAYAESLGVVFHFDTMVVAVEGDFVRCHRGQDFPFDQLLIAAGEEMQLFFPQSLHEAEVVPCRLQMLRTAPQPEDFQLGAIMVSDLTLCHYPAFADCPSVEALRSRLAVECPEEARWGVHVIASQWDDGSLVLGDSHEYGTSLDPELLTEVDDLILRNLLAFVRVPDPRIARRWHGIYLKSKKGQTQVVLHPQECVTMVTAMGGLGMTLSWGLAERTLEQWMK